MLLHTHRENGARPLMLDAYDLGNDVWSCHSSGGKCDDFTALVSLDCDHLY